MSARLSTIAILLLSSGLPGCATEEEIDHCEPREGIAVDPAGTSYRYVVSAIEIPANASRARELGMNLDEDERDYRDNQLGSVFGAINSLSEYDLSSEANALVASGEILQLVDLQTLGLEEATGVGVQVALGVDLDDNPANNHSGSEPLDLDSSVEAGNISGTIADGQLVVELGTAPLALTFPGFGERFIFQLTSARMEATVTENGLIGRIGGAVSLEDVDNNLVPALAEGFRRAIATDCPEDLCAEDSFGELLVAVFDASVPKDYVITAQELRDNSLFGALFAPSLDLYDADGNYAPGCDSVDESLSLSVGFAAVRADFAR